jgi:hypothetical protein
MSKERLSSSTPSATRRSRKAQSEDDYVDTKTLAQMFSIHVRTLQRWRKRGHGPPFEEVRGRILYSRKGVQAWADSRPLAKIPAD